MFCRHALNQVGTLLTMQLECMPSLLWSRNASILVDMAPWISSVNATQLANIDISDGFQLTQSQPVFESCCPSQTNPYLCKFFNDKTIRANWVAFCSLGPNYLRSYFLLIQTRYRSFTLGLHLVLSKHPPQFFFFF